MLSYSWTDGLDAFPDSAQSSVGHDIFPDNAQSSVGHDILGFTCVT